MSNSESWVTEESELWPGQRFSLQIKRKLFHKKSDYQEVEVYESTTYGNILVLDGVIQCTERDEASYQEMMVHIPLCSLKNPPKRVLVVGGGDGGVVREISKYSSVENIDVAEIDKMVVEVSKLYLKGMSVGFSDPRVSLNICNGIEFVTSAKEAWYDAIIVDSSDPVGPAEVLFQKPFYKVLHRALRPGGVICTQAESIWLHLDVITNLAAVCYSIFEQGSVSYATISVPSYPTGQIGFMVCMKGDKDSPQPSPLLPTNLHFNDAGRQTKLKFYNAKVHSAAFMLPQFALDALSQYLTFQ